MRLVHTSDWHVGKPIRGRSRASEHRAVLAEIAGVVDDLDADLVVVAGDLFDSAAPAPESDEIVIDALLRFARPGRAVMVVTGNHDNARRLRTLRPMFDRCGVTLVTEAVPAAAGGVHQFTTVTGCPVTVAMLPFVSQRGIVRAEQLMHGAAFEHAQLYAQRLHALIELLAQSFTADAVNVLAAHAYVAGGATGGGERAAHLVEEYAISSQSFPVTASYVALGHLHRPQQVAGATAMHYCGSPLQLDFGETSDVKQVNIVDCEPGLPARVTPHALRSGRPLRSFTGTLDELAATVVDDDAWLRLIVREPHRAGLGDDVRSRFGDRVVEVRIEPPDGRTAPVRVARLGRTPHELFDEYLAMQRVEDPAIVALFAELLEHLDGGQ